MPRSEPLIGHFIGRANDAPIRIAVYKAGRTYRLTHGSEKHLCHPSVRNIDAAMREALLVFNVKVDDYVPL